MSNGLDCETENISHYSSHHKAKKAKCQAIIKMMLERGMLLTEAESIDAQIKELVNLNPKELESFERFVMKQPIETKLVCVPKVPKIGMVDDDDESWKIGKTEYSLNFVSETESAIKVLLNVIELVKSGEVILADFCTPSAYCIHGFNKIKTLEGKVK